MLGQAGDDKLDGGKGDDLLKGNAGTDTCIADSNDKTKPANCKLVKSLPTVKSFGGTLESAQTFDIMTSDGSTSTYGKQGYSVGTKSAGTGVSVINSGQICGLSLCSEKLSMQERIELYLQALRSK